ncbi:MAG: A24 family peptidase [Candidatus Dormibacteria bacterium]|jgi:Flp pilus assembly protein protease CpaA
MNLALTAGAAAAGAVAGWGSGFLGVYLEKAQGLEREEAEERAEYEAEVVRKAEAARSAGEDPPAAEPWAGERYGWTWIELLLAPLLGAVSFGLFGARHGLTWIVAEDLLWVAVFIHVFTFDLKHRLILNVVTYPALPLAIVLAAVTPGLSLLQAVIGAAAVGGFFLVLHVISRNGLGLGDVKLVALIGAVTGLGAAHYAAVDAVLAGVLLGGVVALLLVVTRIRSLKDPIPYGPFLCVGAVLVLYLSL